MKHSNGIFLFFLIVKVRSQVDVLRIGDNELINDSDGGNIEDDPFIFNILDEIVNNAPSIDYFLEERPHDMWKKKNDVDTVGAAHADPTLHKWKHKLPLFHYHTHSHSHSIGHGNTHGIETSAMTYPVDHQFQSDHSQHKQFSTIEGYGIKPVVLHPIDHKLHYILSGHPLKSNEFSVHKDSNLSPDNNNVNMDKESTHTSDHQISNQLINNQHIHLSNQNVNLENLDSTGKVIYPSDALKPGIVNINGHSNTVIQTGTPQKYISANSGQVFFHEKAPQSSDKDDHIIGISIPVEEQIHWQKKPQFSGLQMNSAEILSPVVYSREMNNILDILDERSYDLKRPEVEHTEGAMRFHEIQSSDDQIDEEFIGNYYHNEGKQQEQNEYLFDSSGELDYNLGSPFIIQIPRNDYFHSYDHQRSSKNNRYRRDINVLSNNSMLFNISSWKLKEMNSKLNDTLLDYQNMVDDYREKITDKRESLFVDLLDSLIGQFQMKEFGNSNEIKKIQKRAAITKLLNDPDATLDIPKTLDNIGIITRNAFEDERSPMYHVRKFIGSTKNAVLSAMKIPPQNLVIPSNYEIKNINPEEISAAEDNMVSGINPKILSRSGFRDTDSMENNEESYPYGNDPYGIVETFARVGGAIRDSVRSGQNTLNHISDIAHNARKIYHTTKNTMPRILLPYAKAPVLKSRFKDTKIVPLKKAIVISPKVLAVKDPVLGASKAQHDFVSMGNILDAIGLTKPYKDKIDLEKIVLKMPGQGETRGIYIPPIGEVQSVNGKMLPNYSEDNEKPNRKTKIQLGHVQDKVVSTNQVVKENITKLKNDISKTINETKKRITGKKSDILEMKQRNNSENNTNDLPQSGTQSDVSNIKVRKNEVKHFTKEEENKIIDEFLYNIFKIDTNPKERSKSHILLNKMKEKEQHGDKTDMNFNRDEKEKTELRFKNNISSSDILPNLTESLLQETIKNITLDILKDEKKTNNFKRKNIKSNRIHKESFNKRNKLDPKNKPKIVLQSRFGDEEDSDTTSDSDITLSPNNSTVERKDFDKTDEEAMRKVDEYVLNDLAAPMLSDPVINEKAKNSFKLGNVLELIEDPPGEESSKELTSTESENGKVPIFSSRNLLWFRDVEERNEMENPHNTEQSEGPNAIDKIVGLNLPPELMTPFMSRASNSNIDEIFDKDNEAEGNNRDTRTMNFNLPAEIIVGSPKTVVSSSFDNEGSRKESQENTDVRETVGLTLPTELKKSFMVRGSDVDIEDTFASDEENAAGNSNNDVQNYLPVLMMPLRTAKSVKKMLGDFIQKENETNKEIFNVQDNHLEISRPAYVPKSSEGVVQPVNGQLYKIPATDSLERLSSIFSNENCKIRKCYESPTNYNSYQNHDPNQEPHNERSASQNFIICVCIFEDSHYPILYNNSPHYFENVEEDGTRSDNVRNEQARTSMHVSENLRKPFMGLGDSENIKKFYAEYNGDQKKGGDLFNSEEEHLLFTDE